MNDEKVIVVIGVVLLILVMFIGWYCMPTQKEYMEKWARKPSASVLPPER